jgi:O-antigen/teichoic acid export membrane protein
MPSAGAILTQIRRVLALLRLRPFDTSSAVGRSMERHRRIALSALVAFLARLLNIVTVMMIVRLTVSHLGNDRYGIWMAATSLVAFTCFADLGLPQALVTLVAQNHGRDDRQALLRYVSSAFLMLALAAAIMIAALLALYPFIDWGRLLGAQSDTAAREAGPAFLVMAIGAVVVVPLSLAQSVRLGFQQNYLSSLWQAAASIIGLIATLAAVRSGAGLVVIAAIPVLAQISQYLADGVLLFGVQRPWLRPTLSAPTRQSVNVLMGVGALFCVLGVTRAIGFSSDNLVLARILGATAATQYNVPQRLFAILPLLLSFVLAPLWPAYTEAISRGDVQWVKNTLRRSLILTLAIVLPVDTALVVFGKQILHLWVGHAVEPSLPLMIGLAVSTALLSISGVPSMFLQGMGVVRFQVVTAILMAIANLALSIVLTYRIGITGVVYGSIISWLICVLIPSGIYIPRLLRSIERRAVSQSPQSPAQTQSGPDLRTVTATS